MVIVPSPSLSKSENASLNSEDKAETSYGYDNLLEQSSYYTLGSTGLILLNLCMVQMMTSQLEFKGDNTALPITESSEIEEVPCK